MVCEVTETPRLTSKQLKISLTEVNDNVYAPCLQFDKAQLDKVELP